MPDDYVKPSDVGYTIFPQQVQTVANDQGGYSPAVVIRFRTPKGNLGVVTVPTADYTAAVAAAKVIAAGEEMDAL